MNITTTNIVTLASLGLLLATAGLATTAPAPRLPNNTWAVVINSDHAEGCSFEVHLRNTELAVATLGDLGYRADHVFVLSEAGEAAASSSFRPMWLDADRGSLRRVMGELETRMAPGDDLVVYLTGHGSMRGSEVGLLLGRRFVPADDLAADLGALGSGRIVLVADVCYAGAFALALNAVHPDVVAVTAADAESTTSCVHFARAFWRALVNPTNDDNEDGVVSVEEAFVVAEQNFLRKASILPSRPGRPAFFANHELDQVATMIGNPAALMPTAVAVLAAN